MKYINLNLNFAPQQALDLINAHTRARTRSQFLSWMSVFIPVCWVVIGCGAAIRHDGDEFNPCGAFPTPLSNAEELELDNMILALRAAIVSPERIAKENISTFLQQQFNQTREILDHYENKFPSAQGYKEAIRTAKKNVTALEEQQSLLETTVGSYSTLLAADSESLESGEEPPCYNDDKENKPPRFILAG